LYFAKWAAETPTTRPSHARDQQRFANYLGCRIYQIVHKSDDISGPLHDVALRRTQTLFVML